MARITVGQKAQRVLKLLLGLRNAHVAQALRQYGFQDADLAEGWRRLKALTAGRLNVRPPGKQDPALLERLDAWENRWFPIASASLKARFPSVHDWLFLNLAQTDGPAVVISVGTFVQRIQRMASEPTLGNDGAEARQLLESRGLDASTLQIASDLLEQLGTAAPAQPVPAADPATHAAAEAALWAWYLEWGEIARVAISDRKLLRELGFLNYKRPVSDDAAADPSLEPGATSQ